MADPFDDARVRAWADDVAARIVPRMRASAAVATIFRDHHASCPNADEFRRDGSRKGAARG